MPQTWSHSTRCVLLLAALVTSSVVQSDEAASRARADAFLASSSALRSLAIVRPEVVTPRIESVLPLSVIGTDPAEIEHRDRLWKWFFSGALIKVGQLTSERPIACYYNALSDVVLCTQWKQAGPRRFEIVAASLLPGEAVVGQADTQQSFWSVVPQWLTLSKSPEALMNLAATRLKEIGNLYRIDAAGKTANKLIVDASLEKAQELAQVRLLALFDSVSDEAALQRLGDVRAAVRGGPAPTEDSTSDLTILAVFATDEKERLLVVNFAGLPRNYLFIECRVSEEGCSFRDIGVAEL